MPVLTDCSRDEASTSLCGAEVDGKASLDNSFGSESLDRQEVKGSLVQHTLCMYSVVKCSMSQDCHMTVDCD